MGAATVGPFDPRIVQRGSPFRLFFRKITKFGAVGLKVIKLPLPFIMATSFHLPSRIARFPSCS